MNVVETNFHKKKVFEVGNLVNIDISQIRTDRIDPNQIFGVSGIDVQDRFEEFIDTLVAGQKWEVVEISDKKIKVENDGISFWASRDLIS